MDLAALQARPEGNSCSAASMATWTRMPFNPGLDIQFGQASRAPPRTRRAGQGPAKGHGCHQGAGWQSGALDAECR
jgi:hypothetical protein